MAICKSITRILPATFAWLLLFISTTIFFVFPCQYLQNQYHFLIAIVQGIITLFVFSNFLLATFMDPGIIPKASQEEDDDDFRAPLFKNAEVNGITIRMKWCVTCKFYRPPRCSHCSVCDTCIETFDHHCPWINNCIGRRNYRHFFFFLVFLSLHMITIFVWCILYILNHKDKLKNTESIITLVLIGLIILLIIPIIGLTLFHVILVSKGRTTNEQVTKKFKNNFNPFSRGCILNCCYILCGPNYPKYKLSRKTSNFFENLEKCSLNEGSSNDRIVKIYLDNEDKSINSKNLSKQSMLNNNKEINKSNFNFNQILNKVDKIDLVLESQSRDCQPSPPPLNTLNLEWQKKVINNGRSRIGNFLSFNPNNDSRASYEYTSRTPQLTSSQSQVLYTQYFQRKAKNGKVSNVCDFRTNLQHKQSENSFEASNLNLSNNQISSNQAQPNYHLYFYNHYKTRPTSPTKSTSINEISPFVHQNFNVVNHPNKPSNVQHNGVVVYYSPEEASNSLMITDLDSTGKFASETELQRLKEHLIKIPEKNISKNYFSKRPMSFMKALEITDKIERNQSCISNTNKDNTNKNTSIIVNKNKSSLENENVNISNSVKEDNKHNQYGINYEISV